MPHQNGNGCYHQARFFTQVLQKSLSGSGSRLRVFLFLNCIGNFEMNSVSKQATLFVGYKKPPIFLTDKSFYRFEKICNHSKFQKFTTRVLGNFVVPVVVPQHF